MNLNTEQFATEISNTLTTTGENYTVKTTDLDNYGTSCEITKHDSDRTLHLTPVEDGLIDIILFDETGSTIASGTLFDKAATDITPEELARLVAICF